MESHSAYVHNKITFTKSWRPNFASHLHIQQCHMEQSTRLILVVNNVWQEVVQTPSIYHLLSKPKRLPRSSWRIRLLTLRNTINLPNVVGEKMLQNDYSKVAWETVIAFDNNLSVPRASSSSAGPTFLLSQNYLAAKTKGLTRHLLRVLVQMNITSVWHLCFIICSNFRTWPVPNWCGISNQTGPNSFHCRKKRARCTMVSEPEQFSSQEVLSDHWKTVPNISLIGKAEGFQILTPTQIHPTRPCTGLRYL